MKDVSKPAAPQRPSYSVNNEVSTCVFDSFSCLRHAAAGLQTQLSKHLRTLAGQCTASFPMRGTCTFLCGDLGADNGNLQTLSTIPAHSMHGNNGTGGRNNPRHQPSPTWGSTTDSWRIGVDEDTDAVGTSAEHYHSGQLQARLDSVDQPRACDQSGECNAPAVAPNHTPHACAAQPA